MGKPVFLTTWSIDIFWRIIGSITIKFGAYGHMVFGSLLSHCRAIARNFYLGGSACGAPGFFVWYRGGPMAILAIENNNKYIAINMQLMYNFAEIYENWIYIQRIFIF